MDLPLVWFGNAFTGALKVRIEVPRGGSGLIYVCEPEGCWGMPEDQGELRDLLVFSSTSEEAIFK